MRESAREHPDDRATREAIREVRALPTIGQWLNAGERLAEVTRRAINREKVTRGEVRRALEAFERVIEAGR